MSTYTIGEVAERSGFSASALRYYEGIGLVEPIDPHRRRLPHLRRPHVGPAGVHRPGQAARLLARGDHRSRQHLGRRPVRTGAATIPRAGHRQDPQRRTSARRAHRVLGASCRPPPSTWRPASRRAMRRRLRMRHRGPRDHGRGVAGDARREANRRSDRLHTRTRCDAGATGRLEQRFWPEPPPERRSRPGVCGSSSITTLTSARWPASSRRSNTAARSSRSRSQSTIAASRWRSERPKVPTASSPSCSGKQREQTRDPRVRRRRVCGVLHRSDSRRARRHRRTRGRRQPCSSASGAGDCCDRGRSVHRRAETPHDSCATNASRSPSS